MSPQQDLEALAPLYALDALDGDDLARFREELNGSEELRALVRDYRDAAASLALSLDPVDPAPEVKSRLMASIGGAGKRAPAPIFTRVFWAAAAVILISLIVQSFNPKVPTKQLIWGGNARGTLIARGRTVEVDINSLPALPEGKVFQLWHIGPVKDPVDQGTFVCDGKGNYHGYDSMKYDIASADAFALTIEPAGGSKKPTMPIVGIAKK